MDRDLGSGFVIDSRYWPRSCFCSASSLPDRCAALRKIAFAPRPLNRVSFWIASSGSRSPKTGSRPPLCLVEHLLDMSASFPQCKCSTPPRRYRSRRVYASYIFSGAGIPSNPSPFAIVFANARVTRILYASSFEPSTCSLA